MFLFFKHENITSNKFCYLIKKKFDVKKIGYSGTLDPSARGLLPLFFNNETSFIENFNDKKKRYLAVVFIGITNDTLDVAGCSLFFSTESLISVNLIFKSAFFLKKIFISQGIPMYSSVKHNGKSLYNFARLNLNILREHVVKLYRFKLIVKKKNILVFDIICNKGTYIRSVINDISVLTNTPLSVYKITRLSIATEDILNAYDLELF